ncbi:ATP-dependent Clp protease ATP-binding subunit clpX-like [Penicillium malachiteum]|uniref:ATP-dependent Clp protease ATP-binding subunit clpX-like n=1 Tax=Penicillium malachiteum TaxID=1324776 RepID=A0AAD6HN49_9EURO|nr:ATP-dependent Clp protease ATP-binding subunit clpX-like [Penicillium malachiteum]
MLWRPLQHRLPLALAHRELLIRCRPSLLSVSHVRQLSSGPTSFPTWSEFNRSDFTNQPYTGSYETGLPTTGPLASTPAFGAPRITPKVLKQYLDQYVVGQERAKKVLSVAVYNHYQRVQELARRKEEAEELLSKRQRKEALEGHPLEDEFPGQQRTIGLPSSSKSHPATPLDQNELVDTSPLQLEKSNILLLGPSGVGKTLMAKTLARVLSVPFSISDCTPFTQAGYIGEDAETCVHRLLAAANYDVEQAERGIIVLDEIDKIAATKVSHGKDVGGEGVQQALLKIIEGTTIQVQAKSEKSPRSNSPPNTYPSNSPLGNTPFQPHSGNLNPSAKGEVYNVRTDNILFIFSGAFVGLHKLVMDRISRGSMGFGQPVRSHDGSGPSDTSNEEPLLILPGSEEEALYKKHLPFFTSASPAPGNEPTYFNALDLLTPADLQTYGFIPELIGRIPVNAALSTLTQPLLLRILTEPRNSLQAQYTALFALSGIDLRFTTPALHTIAANAFKMGTGARALRTEMETILSDAMFEVPGSSVKFVLVTEAVAKREEQPVYLPRGQGAKFHNMIAAEESQWEEKSKTDKKQKDKKNDQQNGFSNDSQQASSFEEYRNRAVG